MKALLPVSIAACALFAGCGPQPPPRRVVVVGHPHQPYPAAYYRAPYVEVAPGPRPVPAPAPAPIIRHPHLVGPRPAPAARLPHPGAPKPVPGMHAPKPHPKGLPPKPGENPPPVP